MPHRRSHQEARLLRPTITGDGTGAAPSTAAIAAAGVPVPAVAATAMAGIKAGHDTVIAARPPRVRRSYQDSIVSRSICATQNCSHLTVGNTLPGRQQICHQDQIYRDYHGLGPVEGHVERDKAYHARLVPPTVLVRTKLGLRREEARLKRQFQLLTQNLAEECGIDLDEPLADRELAAQVASKMGKLNISDPEEWTVDANKCTFITLLQPGQRSPEAVAQFRPAFTYPFFGKHEEILGYQGLRIHVRFAAHDLQPHLVVDYKKRHADIEDGSKWDVESILREWLQPSASYKKKTFDARVQADASNADWTPPGQLMGGYQIKDAAFEVWSGSLADTSVREMLERFQFLVPCLIEGGSYIDTEVPDWSIERWRIYFLYQKLADTDKGPRYSIVGYCTAYRYYRHLSQEGPLDDVASIDDKIFKSQLTADKLPARARISQFLILPPYQHQGHGSRFYNSLFEHFLADDTIKEVAVEDPNETFDDLRDFCDLIRLRQDPRYKHLQLNNSATGRISRLPISKLLPLDTIADIQRSSKLADRQFKRVIEMQLLTWVTTRVTQSLPSDRRRFGRSIMRRVDGGSGGSSQAAALRKEERYYGLWRKMVKQRLLKHNMDTLIQLDRPERIEQLEQVMVEQEKDYVRLLGAVVQNSKPEHGAQSLRETPFGKSYLAGNSTSAITTTTTEPRGTKRPAPSKAAAGDTRSGDNDTDEDDEDDDGKEGGADATVGREEQQKDDGGNVDMDNAEAYKSSSGKTDTVPIPFSPTAKRRKVTMEEVKDDGT